jgi:maleate isomerase
MAKQKARLGVILPDTNTTAEADFRAGLEDIAELFVETMHLAEPVTRDGELTMIEQYAPEAAHALTARRLDLLLFACSSAESLLSPGAVSTFYRMLSDAARCQVVGINAYLVDALHRASIAKPQLLAPYEWPLTLAVRDQLVQSGFDVVDTVCMEIGINAQVGQVTPEEILDYVLPRLHPAADGVLVACGNLRAYECLPALRAGCGVPVVTGNSAVIDGLRLRLAERSR